MTIHERIKQLRKDRRIKQADLAKQIGVPQSTLSKYENGNLRIDTDTLTKIAKALDVSVDELLGRERDHSPFSPENLVLHDKAISNLQEKYAELNRKAELLNQELTFTAVQQEYIELLKTLEQLSTELEHQKYLNLSVELRKSRNELSHVKKLVAEKDSVLKNVMELINLKKPLIE